MRTVITKDKIFEMNKIFNEIMTKQMEKGKNLNSNLKTEGWSLKEIADHLNLGYSTVLHKFREFRVTKKVRAGALVASMQYKRKYRKSIQI